MFARRHLDSWFLVAITSVLLITFWALQPEWLNRYTLQSLVAQSAPLALVAVPMTFAIISSHIDLSPGSMIGLTGAVIGLAFSASGSIWLALVAGLGTALGVGLLHGLFVGWFGLNAVLVTLGTYIWARGLTIGANAGSAITVGGGLSHVVEAAWAGFTLTAPRLVAVYLVGGFLLSRTKLGRYTYAMGGDLVSARRAGINVRLYTTAIFLLMGFAVALASFITVGQLGAAAAGAGTNIELDAIIAVIIGGSRLAGGEGSVGRTAMGVAFITILNSGLLNLGLTDAAFQLYRGAALLTVLSVQVLIRRAFLGDEPAATLLAAEPTLS
jgi:ribose/xylose/arabinose/galactoside ABC-type transport system permease subunit